MENYDLNKISCFIGEEFKKKLTEETVDYIHLEMGKGKTTYPKIREKLSLLIDDNFLDNLYYYLCKDLAENISQSKCEEGIQKPDIDFLEGVDW